MAAYKVRLQDGSEVGPLDVEMLHSWYQQGLVNRESLVRLTTAKRWAKLADSVNIAEWGAAGGTKGRGAPAEGAEDEEELEVDPQGWRVYVASVLFFLIAAGAGYFAWFPARWLPALRQAPWREIALGFVALGLLLVRGWEPMRKVVRVVVFLLTFSLFALAAPVLMQGVQWRPLAILAAAWVMGSGLFFFLAGRPLPYLSIALCLFWIFAGGAAIGYLGFVPPGAAGASASPDPAAAASAAAASSSLSAQTVSRDLPMLSPRAAEFVLSYGVDRPEAVFRQSYLLAANGVGRLTPQEAKELGEITTAAYAPLAPEHRRHLDRYMERVRGLQVTQPQEDREITALVGQAVRQLPEAQRARYQALYEKALGATR
jgi:hypothetical protein